LGAAAAGVLLAVGAAFPVLVCAAVAVDATAEALAKAMRTARVVVLGEVHDNEAQHRLRFQALRRMVEGGVRPALAFEQFDRERQPDIDRARRERPRDADHLIAQAKSGDWEWAHYRPFVQLALDHDLPIVAANLSRRDAMRVAREGYGAVFAAGAALRRGIEALPEAMVREQEAAIGTGHCGLLPESALAAMARAQIARDAAMAESLRAQRDRTVVLLAGNAHARLDIGVPRWLNADGAKVAIGIGLLEAEGTVAPPEADRFDYYVLTPLQARADPCRDLASRLPAVPGTAP
jgi:uncharacterized iron-regulated protein